jgi:hypothetical protein
MLEAVLRTMPEPDPVDVAELHMRTKIDDASARSGGGFQQAASCPLMTLRSVSASSSDSQMPSAAMPSASIGRTFGRSSIPFDRKPTASNRVAKGHLSRFIVALVREQLDL